MTEFFSWPLSIDSWPLRASQLPPVRGPFKQVLDDLKRQEASAFIWAHVTQGEPRFAPCPIEASQPEQVRKDWTGRRGNLWHKLTRPRLIHYIELRKLLIGTRATSPGASTGQKSHGDCDS